jgi:hypothetical protein
MRGGMASTTANRKAPARSRRRYSNVGWPES